MYIRGRISQRASRPEATSPIGPARLPPIQPELAQVVSSPLRFRSRATHCCIRWPQQSSAGTDLCVGPGLAGARPLPRSRRCRWRMPAGRPFVSQRRPAPRATLPTACPCYRETSDNSPPGPPSRLCAKVCARNLCFARRVPEIPLFAPAPLGFLRHTYVSARIQLSPRVEVVEVEQCVEDEEIATDCFAAVHWIIGE